MQLSQIYISDNGGELSNYLQQCQKITRQLIPHSQYQLFNNELLREFIDKNFDKDVLESYDKLKPYSYRSDLGRFCLMYILGGWYLDIAIKPLIQINLPENVNIMVFRELLRMAGGSWGVYTGALYAKPNNLIFLTAIHLIIENCKKNYYGFNALCPTGPNLLGRAFALNDTVEGILFGDVLSLTPGYQIPNKSMVLPNGEIFAFFKAAGGGDLTRLGAKGVNNYNDFYNNKDIYY